ncbi:MAG: hypothetical protein O2840_01230 [bacterium]|nr:hypothetical protein [bacterium]
MPTRAECEAELTNILGEKPFDELSWEELMEILTHFWYDFPSNQEVLGRIQTFGKNETEENE